MLSIKKNLLLDQAITMRSLVVISKFFLFCKILGTNFEFSAPQVQGEDPMAALSKGLGSALSFGSSFIQKAATVTKDNAVKIGNAAAHAGGEIGKKAADGSLTNQGSAVLGSAFGRYKLGWISGYG